PMPAKIWRTTAASPRQRLPRARPRPITRIPLPEALLHEVRLVADRNGKTLRDAILEGLERWLREHRPPRLPAPPSRRTPRLEGPAEHGAHRADSRTVAIVED